MGTIDRKAAIAAYKERKTPAGIFAVRCKATGQVWVGRSRHLDTQQNGLWFALRLGSSMNRSLQAAWNACGEAAFAFEELERLPDEILPYVLQATLKERLAHWRAELGADLI
ncbi:GIY-YIG nuclease family protein [Microvirga sp. TS319]|uniref:GIY-YIG nuclease family protein n=1 Tax=Microvirga sp. TS319 TaxID=3241165 RepID=UPI00351A2850